MSRGPRDRAGFRGKAGTCETEVETEIGLLILRGQDGMKLVVGTNGDRFLVGADRHTCAGPDLQSVQQAVAR